MFCSREERSQQQKEFRKYHITARKYGGDDQYSWAVFWNGRPTYTGLSRYEVNYYKRMILKRIKEKEAKTNGN